MDTVGTICIIDVEFNINPTIYIHKLAQMHYLCNKYIDCINEFRYFLCTNRISVSKKVMFKHKEVNIIDRFKNKQNC